MIGFISLVAVACLVPMYIVYGILRICKDELFVEHSSILVEETKIPKIFQLTYFYQPFLIGIMVALLNDLTYINLIVLLIPSFLYILTMKE
jgi:hypothetical protein